MMDRSPPPMPETDSALLREDIARYGESGGLDFGALMRHVAEEEPRSPVRRWLAVLSTGQRQLLAAAVITLVGGVILWHMGLREDLLHSWQRLAISFSAMLGVVYLTLRMSLRDLADSPPGGWAWAMAGVGLALLLAAPAFSHWLPGKSLALGPFWTLRCFRFTLVIGGVTTGTLLALQRPGLSGLWRALNAGIAGAIASAFFLMMHCTIVDPQHLWSGHTMPGLLVAGLAIGLGIAIRRWRQ